MSRYPLANDLHGDPLDVPEEAEAWRVRRVNGRPGRPQNVYDPETGKQLEIPLDATIDDLREQGCGPGRYRLDAVNTDGKTMAGVVAFTEIAATIDDSAIRNVAAAPSLSNDQVARLLDLLEHVVDTNSRVMEAMAGAFGNVRPPGPVVVAETHATAPQGIQPDHILPTLTSVAKAVADAWKAGSDSAGGGGA